MRKNFICLFILIIALSSCNLPIGQPAAGQNSDEIATQVAATMSALAPTLTQSQPPVDEASATPTVENLVPTLTATATATETVTPTATIPPDDPKLTLGTPDFWFNSASSGDPFGVAINPYEDNAVIISNQVGGLNFTSKIIDNGKRWRLTSPTPTNFYLEGTFKVITCSGKDNYGLAMRVPTYEDFLGYYIGLSCDGSYIVDRLNLSGDGENIITWTPDANIKTGENQVNRLGVMLVNDSFKLYINGVKVSEFTNSVIPNKGHFGAYVSARGKTNFTVDLQELMEWNQ